jgi:hypothetical protein
MCHSMKHPKMVPSTMCQVAKLLEFTAWCNVHMWHLTYQLVMVFSTEWDGLVMPEWPTMDYMVDYILSYFSVTIGKPRRRGGIIDIYCTNDEEVTIIFGKGFCCT